MRFCLSVSVSMCCVFLFAGCSAESERTPRATEELQRPVVYGDDNRFDYYASTNEVLRTLTTNAIAAMVSLDEMNTSNPEDLGFNAGTYGANYGMCDGQPFFDQPTLAGCSATLIDHDLVITAGHCINEDSCPSRGFLFGYYMESEDQLRTLTADDLYACVEVVSYSMEGEDDYAILRLDRAVVDREPADIRIDGQALTLEEPVWMIGFGNGLPAKLDDGGRVVDPGDGALPVVFNATVDAFGGNSGSGVFTPEGLHVGILSAGLTDHVNGGGCNIVNIVPETEEGESIIYSWRAVEQLCAQGYVSERLCPPGEGGWCRPCLNDMDCKNGFLCGPGEDEDAPWRCGATCATDDDCRDDHQCENERCRPRWVGYCVDGDVHTQSACGLAGGEVQSCDDGTTCFDGTCAERAPGDICETAIPIEGQSQLIEGTWDAPVADDYPSCAGSGSDYVYRFEIEEERWLYAIADGEDPILLLRSEDCLNGEVVACNDDGEGLEDYAARLDLVIPAGVYFLVIDSYNPGNMGPYTIDLTLQKACASACVAGTTGCGDAGEVATCVEDEDGCTAWEFVTECPSEEVCVDGACVPPEPGDTCLDPLMLEAVDQTFEVNLASTLRNTLEGSCGGAGRELIYAFDVADYVELEARSWGVDTVLHLREGSCEDANAQIRCNDDSNASPGDGSRIKTDLTPGNTYYLVLDTYELDEVGDVTLELEFSCSFSCKAGDQQCGPEGIERCEYPDEGCPQWVVEQACEPLEYCSELSCVPRPEGDVCANALSLDAVSQVVTGGVPDAQPDYNGSCGGDGHEIVYELNVPTLTFLKATLTGFDTVLHIRESCSDPSTEVICNDDSEAVAHPGSYLEVELEPGTYALFIDSYYLDDWGDYELTLEALRFCDSTCELGATRCDGDLVQQCVVGEDTCPFWSNAAFCPLDQRCETGTCVDAEPGDSCAAPLVLAPESQLVTGMFVAGLRDTEHPSCGGAGVERVYAFTLDEPARMTAGLEGGADSYLTLRSGNACPDVDGDGSCHAQSLLEDLEPGTYMLIVERGDAAAISDDEFYALSLSFGEIPCEGEACEEEVTPGAGDSCADAVSITASNQVLVGQFDDAYSDALSASCVAERADRVYVFELDDTQEFSAKASAGDVALSLRGDSCESSDTELGCAADGELNLSLEAGRYHLVVEAGTSSLFAASLTFENPCEAECEVGALRCELDVPQRCEEAQGCATWISQSACPGGERCVAGRCELIGAGDSCDAATELTGEDELLVGTLDSAYSDTLESSCGSDQERIYRLELNETVTLNAEFEGDEGFALGLYTACELASELSCSTTAVEERLEPGSYYLAVEQHEAALGAVYALRLSLESWSQPTEPDLGRPDTEDAGPTDSVDIGEASDTDGPGIASPNLGDAQSISSPASDGGCATGNASHTKGSAVLWVAAFGMLLALGRGRRRHMRAVLGASRRS